MRNILQNPFAPRQYGQLVKETERVYLFRNIVNSSIIIGDKGVAVVDTQVNQMMARRLLKAIRTITDKPFCTQLTLTITGIIRMEMLFFMG